MEKLIRNLKFTIRLLWKSPGLTITVLLTLALGIGANTAIFTVDYATLLAPLPYPQPDQLVVVWSKIQTYHNSISAGDFTDWKRMNRSFTDINAFTGGAFNIASKEEPENIDGWQVTPGYYKMIGITFLLGRDFLPEEGKVGSDHEVILMHKLWAHLGSDPKILGTSIRINGEPYTVVGVLPPGAYDRGQPQLAVPLAFKPEQLNHDFHWLLSVARLKPGVDHQAGAGRYGCRLGAHRGRKSEEQQGLGSVRRAAEERLPPERAQADAVAITRGRCFHTPDRLRKRCEPAAGTRHGPAEGACSAERHGCLTPDHL